MSIPPSGEQFELRSGDQRAVVAEVGATLREYRAGGREVIDGFAIDEHADGARGQALVPWPNRIRDGRYDWQGEAHQLDVTEVALRQRRSTASSAGATGGSRARRRARRARAAAAPDAGLSVHLDVEDRLPA